MKQEKWFIKQGAILSIIAVIVSVLSFVKEAVFANYFGVSEIADAYTIAIQAPEILFAVIWEAINAIIIPLYTEKLHKEGAEGGRKFASNILTVICIIIIGILVFAEFAADYVIFLFSPGLTKAAHALAVELIRWILPMIFFEGVVRVCTCILNVHNQFVIPRVIYTLRNVGVIVSLFLFANRFGVFAAAYGIVVGIIIESILSLFVTRKYEKIGIYFDKYDNSLKKAAKMTIPVILGIGASEINQMFDKIFASFLSGGSIVSLNYASKLSSIIQTILLNNVITILYPTYSSLAADGKKKELTEIYITTIKTCILLCVPLVFGGTFLKNELVSLAFERGAFEHSSVEIVATLFSCYLINALFATVRSVGVKVFTACYDTRTTAVNSFIGVGINIILNASLTRIWGVYGLAIATVVSSAITSVLLMVLINKKIYKLKIKAFFKVSIKSVAAAVMMILCLCAIKFTFQELFVKQTQIIVLFYSVIVIILGIIVYFVVLLILKTDEVNFVLSVLKRQKSK